MPFIVPANYEASFTADVYFTRIENTVPSMTTVMNFTAVIDNNRFLLNSASMSIVGTGRLVETIFNFPDGTLRKVYNPATSPEIQMERVGTTEPIIVIRDSVIVINDQSQPIAPDTYAFSLSSTIIGIHFLTGIRVSQPLTRVVVEVIAPTGEWLDCSRQTQNSPIFMIKEL